MSFTINATQDAKRLERALTQPIYLINAIRTSLLDWNFEVQSSTGRGTYRIWLTPDSFTCSCPDSSKHGIHTICKHRLFIIKRVASLHRDVITAEELGQALSARLINVRIYPPIYAVAESESEEVIDSKREDKDGEKDKDKDKDEEKELECAVCFEPVLLIEGTRCSDYVVKGQGHCTVRIHPACAEHWITLKASCVQCRRRWNKPK